MRSSSRAARRVIPQVEQLVEAGVPVMATSA